MSPTARSGPSALWLAAILAGRVATAAPSDDRFEAEIRPILVERCLKCHGDEGAPKGGLRMTSRASILAGGDGGPAAVEGKPAESAIIAALQYGGEPRMPPSGKLPDREIEALTKWVAAGLPWPEAPPPPTPEPAATATAEPAKTTATPEISREFWSFKPVTRPEPPAVSDPAWARDEIDRFVLATLDAKGLKPAPEADRRTILRRLTFDLTGLPPTPAEVEAFVRDESADAYERVVDRLLASPRYGERWGRHWLDLVRYADSLDARGSGGPGDIREAWRYRDWVVDAFNADLPFDKFVAGQVAGDLLPPDGPPSADPAAYNRAGAIASTMLTIGNWGNGDADKEKVVTDIVDDQIDVVSRTFLGLTVACARCHDHKFDPISTKDYYGLAGIFFSTHILDSMAAKGAGEAIRSAPLASAAEIRRRADDATRLATLDRELTAARDAASASVAASLRPQAARYLMACVDLRSGDRSASIDEVAKARGLAPFAIRRWLAAITGGESTPMGRPRRDGIREGVHVWESPSGLPSAVANTTGADVSFLTIKVPARSISIHPGPSNPAVISWRSPIDGVVRLSGRISDADPNCGDGAGWSIELAGPFASRVVASGAADNGGSAAIGGGPVAGPLDAIPVRSGDRLRLIVDPRSNHACDTTTVSLTIAGAGGGETWDLGRDLLPDFVAANPHADGAGRPGVWELGEWIRAPAGMPPGLDAWRKLVESGVDRAAIEAAADAFARDFSIADARSPFYPVDPSDLGIAGPAERATIAGIEGRIAKIRVRPAPPFDLANSAADGGVPGTSHAGVGDARVHVRGRYDRLGDVVPRRVPDVIAGPNPPTFGAESGRRELAAWIAGEANPLTARVLVNRLWQHHFGEGLVRTPSNFGRLGQPPTHPELLDALASRMVAGRWSIKAIQRAILLSSTYRQSSGASPDSLRLDPDGRWLSRHLRVRLESEPIRDAMLATSGRLDPTMGGPSIREFESPRRTIYLTTIRSTPYPFGPLFDAADPTALVDRRTSSTVAPQALFLMNSPFAIDCAGALARRIKAADLPTPEARVTLAHALLFGRPPTPDQLAAGLAAVREGDEDAWASYALVLYCSNSFVFID